MNFLNILLIKSDSFQNAEKQLCAAAQAEKLIRKFNGSHIDQALLMEIKNMKSRTSEERFIDDVLNGEQ